MNDLLFDSDKKLRSGWRFVLFFTSFVIISSFVQLVLISAFKEAALSFMIVLMHSASIIISILLGWFFGKIFENLPFKALGISVTRNWLKDFSLGLLFGFFSIFLAILIAYVFDALKLEVRKIDTTTFYSLSFNFLIFLIAAISEETLFRGYMLQTFIRAKSTLTGIILTSLLFASAHNLNPSVNILSLINTFIAGIWLSVAYLKAQNLWFPISIHLSWNWFQGPVFGINVSGIEEFSRNSILQVTQKNYELINGGNYGIEGGLACTASLIVSTILLLLFHQKINIEPSEARPE
ncbi:MAG: CPBP family intramembrane metalloprotease [Pyrinomonadaceae bacterium]|nr:CPBP family intramembrane metalloprotease [Pyrinomonadaceae bacterium]MCX7640436.1 CPBP family intramembrane metalloprotease [Pyrinomonadaceae bacterium]MDW8304863.1 type II CAAX endopeptidase family protein [Acidobacteriota bacterium]